MKNVLYFMFIIIVVAAFSGCIGSDSETTESSGDRGTTTFETDDGTQTVKITGSAGDSADEWCPVGGDWAYESAGISGDASATWKVDRIVQGGKYDGLCHVIFSSKTPDGEVTMDYYFDETGKNGYFEMDVHGQKITQEFHA